MYLLSLFGYHSFAFQRKKIRLYHKIRQFTLFFFSLFVPCIHCTAVLLRGSHSSDVHFSLIDLSICPSVPPTCTLFVLQNSFSFSICSSNILEQSFYYVCQLSSHEGKFSRVLVVSAVSAECHIHHLLLVWECQGAAETGELWMVTWLAGAVLHPTAPKQEEQGCSTGLVARFSRESRSPGKSLLMEKACGQARKWSQ